MVFFDWLLGKRESCGEDPRLKAAVNRVIEGTDPRLRFVDDVDGRLCPAVAHALAYADQVAAGIPPMVVTSPSDWAQSAVLRAMFVRPAEVTATLSNSLDLHDFLASPAAGGIARVYCMVAATRIEQTVLGPAMDGGQLRRDVQQKTVSFQHFRLFGFAPTEEGLRSRIRDIVLEGLVLAALRVIAAQQHRSETLSFDRKLLQNRLRLMEQSRPGLDALECHSYRGRDVEALRRDLADNEAALKALESFGPGLEARLAALISTLEAAESVIRAEALCLWLDAMNIQSSPGVTGVQAVPLFEFSTATPGSSRRTAFLASIPREAVAERTVDFEAGIRML